MDSLNVHEIVKADPTRGQRRTVCRCGRRARGVQVQGLADFQNLQESCTLKEYFHKFAMNARQFEKLHFEFDLIISNIFERIKVQDWKLLKFYKELEITQKILVSKFSGGKIIWLVAFYFQHGLSKQFPPLTLLRRFRCCFCRSSASAIWHSSHLRTTITYYDSEIEKIVKIYGEKRRNAKRIAENLNATFRRESAELQLIA